VTLPAAAILLGMVAFIAIFIYPHAWQTHIKWMAMLLVLLCRGPGALSVDHQLQRGFGLRLR